MSDQDFPEARPDVAADYPTAAGEPTRSDPAPYPGPNSAPAQYPPNPVAPTPTYQPGTPGAPYGAYRAFPPPQQYGPLSGGGYAPPPAGGYAPPSGGGFPPPPSGFGPVPGPPPPAEPRRPRLRTALVGTAVLAAVIGGGVGAITVAATDNHSSAGSTGLSLTTATAQNSAKTDGSIASAAAKITPSVVTINVTGSTEAGTGSGVIIRSDGYILTNDHVVSIGANGGSISVMTADGRTAPATIVGRDTGDDLAVIKVSGLKNLATATFAKSSSAVVGQTVVAVGAPLGLSDTVTSGIVSATARTVRSGDSDQAVFAAIQTDAAINPGNSGGALTDLNGNVLGINAAIASTTSSGVTIPGQQPTQSGSIGIGFAIPSDEASRIAGQLIATGKSTHAALGVSVKSDSSNGATAAGATLASVDNGSAAASAGLKVGDVVTAVDNLRIGEADDLIAAIRAHAPQDTVTITYNRAGASHTVKVKLGTEAS